ncbi:MAG: hypothetical protein EXR71_14625 [Myxococcales bacterium]|nr:hypothetical protein [Myxococcales bacterium]
MIALVATALAFDLPPPPPPADAPAVTWTLPAEARMIGTLPPAGLVLDDQGHGLGQGMVLDTRLRLGLDVKWKGVDARTEWDLFDTQVAGDPWDIRGTEDARHRESTDPFGRPDVFTARRLSLAGRIGVVALEGGLVTSHWGLGMLANDGAHDPEFGRNDFGDRVLRLRAATRPLADRPLIVAIAGDRVVEDESADWSPLEGGETAWQGVATVIYGEPAAARGGVYYVYRDQTELDGIRNTQAHVVDLYGELPLKAGAHALRLAVEGAGILGTTSRAQSYNSRDGLDLGSAGVTALAELTMSPLPLRAALRGGWASGDADPDDGRSEDFGFDRDFDAGLVLFDELQGAIDAATYAQLSDPAHSGSAPDGAETLVGEGAVRAASFVQPLVEVTPTPWLSVKAGVLFAWSSKPVQQAFTTFRAGGIPTNHLGEPTEGYGLGTEFDWAVTLGDVPLGGARPVRPALLVQGGHLLASANLGGGTLHLVSAALRVRR